MIMPDGDADKPFRLQAHPHVNPIAQFAQANKPAGCGHCAAMCPRPMLVQSMAAHRRSPLQHNAYQTQLHASMGTGACSHGIVC